MATVATSCLSDVSPFRYQFVRCIYLSIMTSGTECVVYRYYGFDKFDCFTWDPAKPFRLCPEDVGAVRSVHVGWANAIFVTEASIAELRGLGGPKQLDAGATQAVLGIRGHWIVLGVKAAVLGRGCKTLRLLGPLQAAALGPTLALLLCYNGSMQEVHLDGCRMSSVPVEHRVRHVSCGHGHQLALTVDGQLLSWGNGGHGQLGHGGLECVQSPRLIEPLAGVVLVGAAAGGWHSAALSDAGDLYLWGWNLNGQLATEPKQKPLSALPVLLDMDVRAVSLGSRHTAALSGNNSAWAWGSNAYGQLGPGADGMAQSTKPVRLAAKDAVAVHCSPWATLLSIKL
ncbi:RCC1 and BTB domain-containing protein 1 isoform X2 [Rhipicephalus sanguineus]|uniref:RCC1 and BTB domain-containing protein 1 isoform X2 n=1 Tax=Rhipicephalus sanguineus TaxID=34632 RepID=UPI001894CDED|nr:RCC1 and BTB domain-containing protein 1 isoform X2 [Rhipicephalus sanguineus]